MPSLRFSVVTAVYNVERYLPEFIESIDRQTLDEGLIEVIAVDDGSTDDSGALLDAWAARRPDVVRVLHQENAGQGAARNAGMAVARGEWVTFPDPDDVVDDTYLRTVHDFIDAHPAADMVAVNRWLWRDDAEPTNNHPLETFFRYDRLVDLEDADGRFHGSAPAAFFRRSVIREHELEYDGRIRPNFEDGHFCSRYLLRFERPQVGFLKSTRYLYRKRSDGSSSLGGSLTDPRRFTDVMTHGYLAILDEAERVRGSIPSWLRHFVCYEIGGYFQAAQNPSVSVLSGGPAVEAFHESVRELLTRVDAARTLATAEFPLTRQARLITQFAYRDEPWHDESVFVDRLDRRQQLVRVRYRYTGTAPTEVVHIGDSPCAPRHAKVRDITLFGRTLMHERVMWVGYKPDVRVKLDGSWTPVSFDLPHIAPPTKVTPVMARRHLVEHVRGDYQPHRYTPRSERQRMLLRLAASKPVRKRYADAWVLMDRVHDASDSGEILFKHLRRHHPQINAWFTVTKDSPDYRRLRTEGYGDRLVAHGSRQWRLLMANCVNLLSSHADAPVMHPPGLDFLEPTWRFTFLQHGVIKDDLSRWLNPKQIDLFVTSTSAEHASIAGDHTSYPFTTKETILTGLPRFDRLVEIAARFPGEQRDLVLLTPTWRQWLVQNLSEGSQERQLAGSVLDTEFVREWMGLLKDPALAEACDRAGVRLAFLPHPNLQKLVPRLDLPDHVLPLSYEGGNVQEYFARARVLVTDYSSIAFNAAYLERPVVYFQFDQEQVSAGAHVGQPGYFSYEEDGFGPVVPDRPRAIAAVEEALAHGGPLPEYQRRIEQAFPQRDHGCCERVVQAVLRADRPDTDPDPVPAPRATA